MKKLAIILALLLIPMTAFGMDTISDSDLDAVTGQAGVSIALNSICIQNTSGTTSYGDVDQDKWIAIVQVGTRTRTIGFHAKDSGTFSTGGSYGTVGLISTTLDGIPDFDALTIDIVDINDVASGTAVVTLKSLVVAEDLPVTSDAAVKIELCDVIQIEEDTGLKRYIYMADTADAAGVQNGDMIIAIYSAAGTTRIIGADMGTHTVVGAGTMANLGPLGNDTTPYYPGENTSILISAHGSMNN
jgi:hypothetical protein